MADQTRKRSLNAELDKARSHLTGYVTALRHDLDVGARLKASYAQHPVAWLGTAGTIGLLLSKILARRKIIVKAPASWSGPAEKAGKAAFVLTVLKFALSLAKPAIVRLFTTKILHRPTSPVSGRN